jgi:hypothetical protein
MSTLTDMQEIVSSIIHHVVTSRSPEVSSWRIVLTNDIPEAYVAWGNPDGFVYWDATSSREAQAIESSFTNEKGMHCATDGELDSDLTARVCIFPAG